MIESLEIKAKQEKYYSSLRYFSHLLPLDRRYDFIKLIGNYNIYLAAQCALTSQQNKLLEQELVEVAERKAKLFQNPDQSALGFLALAEFESFEIILSLLSKIKVKPIHNQIFRKVLTENNPNIFYQFLKILNSIDKPLLIQYAISAYNGPVKIDSENKEIFNKLISHFLSKGHFGMLRVVLTKYKLFDEYTYITGRNSHDLIYTLWRENKLTAFALAYELERSDANFTKATAQQYIDRSVQRFGKKGVLFCLKVAVENDLHCIEELDLRIQIHFLTLPQTPQSAVKEKLAYLNHLLDHDLTKYIATNINLSNKINHLILSRTLSLRTKGTYFENMMAERGLIDLQQFEMLANSHAGSIHKFIIDNRLLLAQTLLETYFTKELNITFAGLTRLMMKEYLITFSEINRAINKFVFEGKIKQLTDYGAFITCNKIKSEKALFIETKAILRAYSGEAYRALEVGSTIKFSILEIRPPQFTLLLKLLPPS